MVTELARTRRERPILFSAPMVRAILDGSKTQTRRVAKLPHNNPLGQREPTEVGDPSGGRLTNGDTLPLQQGIWHTRTGDSLLCPHDMPGDRLWVRETWSIDFAGHYPHDRVWYATDDDRRLDIETRDGVRGIYSPESGGHVPFRWRPSIHMPRWASRITLEITGVRVKRLNNISCDDARAEGWNPMADDGKSPNRLDPKSWFLNLWSQINGPDSWTANPWVWIIEFERVALNALARKTFP